MNTLYCFVDETGQDTKGKFFLVSIVLIDRDRIDILEKKLSLIESSEKIKSLRWKGLPFRTKINLLEKLSVISELGKTIFYSAYEDTTAYTPLVALSIAKAILAKCKNCATYIIIDGLNDRDREIIRRELKRLKIKYKKIRGLKDEQNIFLRLAHLFANFIRDYKEKQKYAVKLMTGFEQIVSEV